MYPVSAVLTYDEKFTTKEENRYQIPNENKLVNTHKCI
jgi:hypothetical protein